MIVYLTKRQVDNLLQILSSFEQEGEMTEIDKRTKKRLIKAQVNDEVMNKKAIS